MQRQQVYYRTWLVQVLALVGFAGGVRAQTGSIAGTVQDRDFPRALEGVEVSTTVGGSSVTSTTDANGRYRLEGLQPGTYRVVFTKPGYVTQFRADVPVSAGQAYTLDVFLIGRFVELDEYVAEEAAGVGAGGEEELLQLRFEADSLVDSVSSEFMGKAGASDAADAVRLVAGATIKDGKSAVIRGLPDRYVSAQLNGVRLPTSEEDKRAVELDQFPSPVIDNIRVTKTFTPEQQGDASGGAVDVRLKEIPDEGFISYSSQVSYNSQASFQGDFLSYAGGGLEPLGLDDGGRNRQLGNLGGNWDGAVGVSETGAPLDWKASLAGGGKRRLSNGALLGGFVSLFYERDSSHYDEGIDDTWAVRSPGEDATPERSQEDGLDTFKTSLFDVTQSSQQVQLGLLTAIGYETEQHELGLSFLYTRTTEDKASIAEDTRGKEFFFPGHDPADFDSPGHDDDLFAAPYLRLHSLEYQERDVLSLQLRGKHELPFGKWRGAKHVWDHAELDWIASASSASLDQPDKRLFGSLWVPAEGIVGRYLGFKPVDSAGLGNLQRLYKTIDEDSLQATVDLELPFRTRTGHLPGALRFGVFADRVSRSFDQDTYTNEGDSSFFDGGFDTFWTDNWLNEDHPIEDSTIDVDFEGDLDISSVYSMFRYPLGDEVTAIGGARLESTSIDVINDPEEDATWFPPDATGGVDLEPGDADVFFDDTSLLPAIGVNWEPADALALRFSFSQTVARQTFKELSPILQQEFAGGPVFIGNPELVLSKVDNYDFRAEYTPYAGGLWSCSYFLKDIEDAIEFVQRDVFFKYTTAVNYPSGRLSGVEFEVRQDLSNYAVALEGVGVGLNATFIDSEVTLPQDEQDGFSQPTIDAPISSRDMTNAPEHLYNLYLTYDVPDTGTQLGIFYTVTGDSLVEGAGQNGQEFFPSVYQTEFGTLNVSLAQRIGKHLKLTLKGKNLTNPEVETVFRSEYIGNDILNTRTRSGIDLSLALSFDFAL